MHRFRQLRLRVPVNHQNRTSASPTPEKENQCTQIRSFLTLWESRRFKSGGNRFSAETLVILAQAFGLASAFNTAISDSYLFTQNAATIKKLVRKTTEAYRSDLAKKLPPPETEITYPIGSPSAAYHHMREYLALCLPPTIQAQIEDLVTNAKATPENSATDAALTAAKASVTANSPPLTVGAPMGGSKSATTSITVK